MGRKHAFIPWRAATWSLGGINGSGMHTNLSVTRQAGWDFIGRILASASDICLVLNSSVNSYRRLDPHFEAPNQIKASAIDRGSMVRIPLGNERSARVEVRSIAPDARYPPWLEDCSSLPRHRRYRPLRRLHCHRHRPLLRCRHRGARESPEILLHHPRHRRRLLRPPRSYRYTPRRRVCQPWKL